MDVRMEFKQQILEIIEKNFLVGADFDLEDSESFLMPGAIDSIGMIELDGLMIGK